MEVGLAGGSPTSPIVVARKAIRRFSLPMPSRSMTEAAREALRRLDAILAENSQSLHGTIENLSTFTARWRAIPTGSMASWSDRGA